MEWLNYHHLYYFWVVAREGSVAAACDKLLLAQPTISGQLRKLESALGAKLFRKAGRGLELTDTGRVAFRYAEEIFSLGRELTDTLHRQPSGRPLRLLVGVADVVPKLVAYRLIAPALQLPDPVRIVCHEDKNEPLLARLAMHGLDIVLSDGPVPPSVSVKAYHHLLAESTVTVCGAPALARKHQRGFPQSLHEAPWLMPTANTALRRDLDQWFDQRGLKPSVQGEFEDSALMKVFGEQGLGLLAVPTLIAPEACRQYKLQIVGELSDVRERYFAITVERRLKHPAAVAISAAAKVIAAARR